MTAGRETNPPRPSRDQVMALFREFRRAGDRRVRNRLIELHRGLAAHVARRFGDRGEPFDDLFQVAALGMLKAVERFDPDRGLEFSTFAVATMEGELKRHFRDHTWSIRVPRRSQELHLALRSAVERLSHTLSRAPAVSDLAGDLGVTEEQVLEAMEVGATYRSASLEASYEPDRPGPEHEARLATEETGFDAAELRHDIAQILSVLPPREQEIVRLRYLDDLTQSQIAERVGVSQMHVSRLLARSLNILRSLEGVDRPA